MRCSRHGAERERDGGAMVDAGGRDRDVRDADVVEVRVLCDAVVGEHAGAPADVAVSARSRRRHDALRDWRASKHALMRHRAQMPRTELSRPPKVRHVRALPAGFPPSESQWAPGARRPPPRQAGLSDVDGAASLRCTKAAGSWALTRSRCQNFLGLLPSARLRRRMRENADR